MNSKATPVVVWENDGIVRERPGFVLVLNRVYERGSPGHFAPASLKREAACPRFAGQPSFSGAFRPGLIEAPTLLCR